jgi:hypothetical protein
LITKKPREIVIYATGGDALVPPKTRAKLGAVSPPGAAPAAGNLKECSLDDRLVRPQTVRLLQ